MDLAFVTRLGLLMLRPGMLIVAAPPFGGQFTPAPVKIGLTLVLGIVLAPGVVMPSTMTLASLAVVAVREVMIGIALALSVRVLLSGAELAGQLAGFQLGFAYAAAVDPNTGARNNLLATLYSSVTLFTFLAINGHHVLLQALGVSYQVMPIGLGHVGSNISQTVAAMFGLLFVFGVQVVSPVLMVMLIAETALGLISRAAPSLNLMAIGFPIRLLAGLAALSAAIGVLPSAASRLVTPAMELASRLALAFK